MFRLPLAFALLGSLAQHASALEAVAPIPGYACASLNLPDKQLREGPLPVIHAGPGTTTPAIGTAAQTVLVATDTPAVNGFLPVLHLDGQQGWIDAGLLRSWRKPRSESVCRPMWMNDGKPGFG